MKIRHIVFPLFAAMIVFLGSGCGDDKGKSSPMRTEDPIKLIVSFAGRLDGATPTQGAVLAIRTVSKDGTLSQPFVSLSQFPTNDFLFYNQSVELLKKNCFYIELRDKEQLGKLFWSLRKGYSNVGLVDRNSTFLAGAMLKQIKEKKTPPGDIAFFIERASGEKVPSLAEHIKYDRVEDLEKSFGTILDMWVATRDSKLVFPWGIASRKKDQSRGMELARATVLALAMEEGGRESSRWLPLVFGGFESDFMDIAADEVAGAEWNVERVRLANALFFFLKDEFPAPEKEKNSEKASDKTDKTQDKADKKEKFVSLTESIDNTFSASVLGDNNYDLRRKIDYLSEEARTRAPYDTSKGAAENFNRFVGVFNKAVEKTGKEYKVDPALEISQQEFDVFMDKARVEARTMLEKLREKGKGPVMTVR